jgi:hypothetical protein
LNQRRRSWCSSQPGHQARRAVELRFTLDQPPRHGQTHVVEDRTPPVHPVVTSQRIGHVVAPYLGESIGLRLQFRNETRYLRGIAAWK